MQKPSHTQNIQPLTDGYKVRVCMGYVIHFMSQHEGNIKDYTLFEFWKYLQHTIDQEKKDI